MTTQKVTRRGLVGSIGASTVPLAAFAQRQPVVAPTESFQLVRRGAVARPSVEKLAESVAITDFGAQRGRDVVSAMERALEAFPAGEPGVLTVPAGKWLIGVSVDWSRFKHVTLRIEPGAVFQHGKNQMILPARVETGTMPHVCFAGEGKVAVHDKDAVSYPRLPKGWTAYSNFAVGVRALSSNIAGTNNFAWGSNALCSNISGSSNIAIGNDTLIQVKGGSLPAMGTQSGHGWNNVAVGDTALRDCTEGYENLAIGAFCLQQTTIGKWNVAVGHASQILATDGECNVSLGAYSLVTNFGSNNLAIGWAALEAQVTGSNIAIGHMAMNANVTGSLNTAIGSEALMRLKSGKFNVSVGLGTLTNLVSGENNTGIGTYALSSAQAGASNNTALGRDALLLLTTGNGNTALGAGALSTLRTFSNCTGIGMGAATTGGNQVQLGNSQAVPHAFAALQIRSDARDKADVRDTRLGLDFIRALRPVDFRWDLREDYAADASTGSLEPGTRKRARHHHGLVAQDVRAVIERTGIDFGGFQDHSKDGGEDVLSLGYEEMIAPLIKAVQQLSSQVDDLQQQVRELKGPVH